MQTVRTAVIGVGYLGRFHALKYAALPACELVAVVDANATNREAVAAETRCRAVAGSAVRSAASRRARLAAPDR